jgi:hypothetical protein
MKNRHARITRVHTSWRVRVPGLPAAFFADGKHGGEQASLAAAIAWRDARWDGKFPGRKLSPRQRAAIRKSARNYREIAERYGISPNYVHQLRRGV